MNKEKLSQMRHKRVRIRPVARRIDELQDLELEQIDDAWIIADASRQALELLNPRSQQYVTLGTDHVREFMSDFGGGSDGIPILKSQVFLFARQLPWIEPLVQK
jgi:hypothetical protein